ncbi:MAG: TRAP transporter TatT component family protein [Acidobacteriota bacterium]|nr:TRAP transporter TatT component family protein [Acidobacteriota bacterium]
MFEEAKKLLAEREADHPANLLAARDLLQKETDGSGKAEACQLLSEVMFWLGEYSHNDKEKDEYFKVGVDAGKNAVKYAPDEVQSYLWYAANMGAHGVVRGIMSSLFYIKDIEKAGKRAMELDEHYFHGAPLRLMGRFYHQCPGFPIGPGDKKKSLKLLEKAVELGPEFYMNYVYLADILLARYKKAKAKELLDRVIAAEPEELPDYHKNVVVPEAEILLKKC